MKIEPGKLISKYRRIIIFGAVGIMNTAVDFGIYTLLLKFTPLPLGADQAAGYIAGTINSFVLNKGVTFKKGASTTLGAQIIRFLVVNGVSLGLSVVLIQYLVKGLGQDPLVAKVIVTVFVMIINYIGYKVFVFGVRDKKSDGERVV